MSSYGRRDFPKLRDGGNNRSLAAVQQQHLLIINYNNIAAVDH